MRLSFVLGFLLLLPGLVSGAFANPFGVGLPAEPVPGFGFEALIVATAQAQSDFYQGLTNALRAVADSAAALWTLLGLSFAYGVVHAAGPGHGKVVIGSYMLASGDTARRGAFLAFGSAMLQASVAVGVVGVLAGLFGLSQAVLSSTTITLERFGYGLIVVLGCYLLFIKLRGLVGSRIVAVHAHAHAHAHAHSHGHTHHVHDEHCGCGHSHVPDAEAVAHNQSVGQTFALIVGAGLRPCTGALLVLVLALSQNLFWAGALAAYAMGAGTALTVGILAIFAGGLSRFFQSSEGGGVLRHAPTIFAVLGSLAIVCFGALLLAASLAR